jgi:hypothetical protein
MVTGLRRMIGDDGRSRAVRPDGRVVGGQCG